MDDKLLQLEKLLIDKYIQHKENSRWNSKRYTQALKDSTPPSGLLGANAYKYERDPLLDVYAAREYDHDLSGNFCCELLGVIYDPVKCPKCGDEASRLLDLEKKHGEQRELWYCSKCTHRWMVSR